MWLTALKSALRCTIFARRWSPSRWLIVKRDRSEFLMASSEITLEALPSVSDIPAAEWDACANPRPDPNSLANLDTLASGHPAADSCAELKKRL